MRCESVATPGYATRSGGRVQNTRLALRDLYDVLREGEDPLGLADRKRVTSRRLSPTGASGR